MQHFFKLLITLLLLSLSSLNTYAESPWQELDTGLHLGEFKTKKNSTVGDSIITILKIDPAVWEMDMVTESEFGNKETKTAKQWGKEFNFTAVINAGMFAADYSKHIGYMQTARHKNNTHLNKYQSIAAFSPKSNSEVPEFQIFDLDKQGVSLEKIRENYESIVQNLRLIKKPGINRWSQQEKMWSEAALGEDKDGNILFIFSRSPFTMYDLNKELIGLGVIAAQHLEGGPEAQLYIKLKDYESEMFGSFETKFVENDKNGIAWPIPNVIGIRKK